MTDWMNRENDSSVRTVLRRDTRTAASSADRKGTAPMLGGASIIMVFAVLCLTIFAVLTILTADNERRLSESYALSTENYYKADTAATAFASSLTEGTQTGGRDGFRRAAEAAGADSVAENADGTLRAEKLFPIDENQALCAVLESSATEVRVLRWQTVYTGDWAPDDGIELWNIEPEE